MSRGAAPFPADPLAIACFLVAYCTINKSVQSLDNALSAVRTEARDRGQELSRVDEWYLKRVRRGLRKDFRQHVKRKRPITARVLYRMARRTDLRSLAGLQYLTMCFLAHDACLRAGEVLALRWSDITWEDFDRTGTPRVLAVTIRRSKARYTEGSETVRVPRYRLGGKPLSAAHLLRVYMHDPEVLARQQGDAEAYLFPSLFAPRARSAGQQPRPGQHVPVVKSTWVRWVRQQTRVAGYDADEFSGHSFRAGGATDLHSAGVAEVLGRLLGRWRSREAYLLYLRQSPAQQAAELRAGYERAFHG